MDTTTALVPHVLPAYPRPALLLVVATPFTIKLITTSHPQFRFLGDPSAEFTKALDLDFDASKIFGGVRSKRYALVIEDGKVKSVSPQIRYSVSGW